MVKHADMCFAPLNSWEFKFSLLFFLLQQGMQEVYYKWSKLAIFFIDFHSQVPQDGTGMYPSRDVMFIIMLIDSLPLYVNGATVNLPEKIFSVLGVTDMLENINWQFTENC